MLHHFCRFGSLFLCVLLLLSLLTGCTDIGGTPIPKPESLSTNNTSTVFTSLPEQGRGYWLAMLDANGDWKDNPKTDQTVFSLTYTGETVSFVYQLGGTSDPGGEQMGISLYLDGVPQPFTVGEADGITPCDRPVEEYYFDAYRQKTYCIPITFTPVCGYAGDTLPLFVVFTPSPNYRITKIKECHQSNWMCSISANSYPVYMEADAPEQKTVDVQQIDTGVQPEGEDGFFAISPLITSRSRETIEATYEDPGERGKAFAEAGYASEYTVDILKPEEGNILNVMVQGISSCTPLYRFQLRLDGKAVPLFDGKYYGDARIANTNKTFKTLVSLDFDLTEYPEVRTVQLLMIPLPEREYTWKEAGQHHCRISTPRAAWIRYDGDEIE